MFWGEYIPNWLSAIFTGLGLIAASGAAFYAWRAITHEDDREERRAAAGLAAWWAHGDLDGKDVWGIVVINTAPAVFHDVQGTAAGNKNPKARYPIEFRVLPPGTFFVESLSIGAAKPWGVKQVLPAPDVLSPLTDADTRRVRRIDFRDSAGHEWTWEPTTGLARRAAMPRSDDLIRQGA
ncbi:hypothetical protein ACO2Q7_17075 [Rathayibacter sp. KR2-224]|uniref:hypothetical protein n=1 Tax=Rathayibacter sp. KR2-224 TaxID=3400913 RepID=UPI003C00490D